MPSSECKAAERRIGKDIGRFGIVKLRNNAEKIYKYIFKIYGELYFQVQHFENKKRSSYESVV